MPKTTDESKKGISVMGVSRMTSRAQQYRQIAKQNFSEIPNPILQPDEEEEDYQLN